MKFLSVILLLCVFFGCDTKEKAEQGKEEFIEVSMPTIVNDVVGGGLLYEEKHIKIRAEVKGFIQGSIELQTHYPNVYFFLKDKENPETIKQYKEGESYTFKLYVYDIDYTPFAERPPNRFINAHILESSLLRKETDSENL